MPSATVLRFPGLSAAGDGGCIDSCHVGWMQLHEDLLATLGLERSQEVWGWTLDGRCVVGLTQGIRSERRPEMRTLVVNTRLTLDGVMQAPD